MNHTTPHPRDDTTPGHLLARLAIVTTTAAVATIGPGLAIAQALAGKNHNEVMVTGR
ncbi:hypothetical protein ACFQZZ_09825 [Nocardia sp. GCM10030253]|uniref:hypothetical protein n=1 Tax=Nocardia sp. GCM10030253 TaxID=3273404 RepID=UPI003629F47F